MAKHAALHLLHRPEQHGKHLPKQFYARFLASFDAVCVDTTFFIRLWVRPAGTVCRFTWCYEAQKMFVLESIPIDSTWSAVAVTSTLLQATNSRVRSSRTAVYFASYERSRNPLYFTTLPCIPCRHAGVGVSKEVFPLEPTFNRFPADNEVNST